VIVVLVSSAGTVVLARTGLRRGGILALVGRLTTLARFFIYLCCHRERRRRVAIRTLCWSPLKWRLPRPCGPRN